MARSPAISVSEVSRMVQKRAETVSGNGGGNGGGGGQGHLPSQAASPTYQVAHSSARPAAGAVNHAPVSSRVSLASAAAIIPRSSTTSNLIVSSATPSVIPSSSAKPKPKAVSKTSSNIPLNTADSSLAAASGGGNSSSTTNTIIGVSASIGALLILFLLWKYFRRRRLAATPLPPVQPLARFREQEIMRQTNSVYRPVSTWNSSSPTDVDNMSNSRELWLASQVLDTSVTRKPTSELAKSPLSRPEDLPLEPSLSEKPFPTDSSSSSGSKDFSFPPSGYVGTRRATRSPSQSSLRSTNSKAVSYAQSSPSLKVPNRPPSSMSYRGGNTPHSMYGGHGFQIVLPTPLATQSVSASSHGQTSPARRSTLVDVWAPRGVSEATENPFANSDAISSQPSPRAGPPKLPSLPYTFSNLNTQHTLPRSPDTSNLPYR